MCRPRRHRPLETRAQHPGAGTLTAAPAARRVVGIDLGTTNSALAWAEQRAAGEIFEVPQLVAAGEVRSHQTLPSFLYFTDQAQRDSAAVALPWDTAPELVAGVFARDEGALVPARQISSAKSWLSNPHVDRTAALLPWGSDTGPRLSPVESSARLLAHLRDAWNHRYARTDDAVRLEAQQIVLTVPASFDEEARELTVQAARTAGFIHLTLLEEPLAALYSWIASHRRQLAETFAGGALILVCDVGGGTTDFSLIQVRAEEGELTFERVAIGEHLLLGGDNLDLALAALAEQKLSAGRLSVAQRQVLRRKCTAAKEALLSDAAADRLTLTVLGSGRGVVGGGMTTELTRDEVLGALTTGFLPLTGAADLPARDRRPGLRELGLPYETEPAITRHLAAFLTRAAGSAGSAPMAHPDAVLFNGGFFTPSIARNQLLDALTSWFGVRPRVLENASPEAAVALGAAFYGKLRQDPVAAKRLLIRAGSARSYYIGVSGSDDRQHAICVVPRGTEEGSHFELAREFTVVSNQPAAFTLYSSPERADAVDALIDAGAAAGLQKHAPLVTAFRYGKRSRQVLLTVHLSAAFTETDTLELWCRTPDTGHRWRLAFNLRGVEADPLDEVTADPDEAEAAVIVDEDALGKATGLLVHVFGGGPSTVTPQALVGELENALGHGKQSWPLSIIRRLADVLLQVAGGRSKGAAFEVRWLNLAGFCVRPGFGSALDDWRVAELRKVYASGLAFPRETQNQVEWLVLWQRVGAGFTAGQQRELAQRVSGQLGLGQRKPGRLNAQIEREAWRLLASLERLDAGQRARLGDALIDRAVRDSRNVSWWWAMGRLGARQPLYGPLNAVVSPAVAERWIATLLEIKELTVEAAAALAQIGARTGDAARDISEAAAGLLARRLEQEGWADAAARVTSVVETSRSEAGRVFGEALPEGLRLAAPR